MDSPRPLFEKGGKFEKFYPVYEMVDTFLFTPGEVTHRCAHVRDGLDLKRMMMTVAWALGPCILMALYNTGYQANLAISKIGVLEQTWRLSLYQGLGFGFDPNDCFGNLVHGVLYFLPIFLVTNIVGGLWEVLFATIRKHEINEGFLVTGLLFPLTLPPTIPLWQVAIGISFGVVFGKEIYGGTGKNFLNPALTARAFLFFAYPAQISGDAVWVAADGFTSATSLSRWAEGGLNNLNITWDQAFYGLIPGSMGETSTLACLLGAAFLVLTQIGSWRIMVSVILSSAFFAFLFNCIGSATNPMFSMTPAWHFVLGGFAFGTVFMATDPVSAAMTFCGQYVYGALIGLMIILIRVVNPAFPEGTMLAILFGNVFAPLIDYFVVNATIKRRKQRYG